MLGNDGKSHGNDLQEQLMLPGCLIIPHDNKNWLILGSPTVKGLFVGKKNPTKLIWEALKGLFQSLQLFLL